MTSPAALKSTAAAFLLALAACGSAKNPPGGRTDVQGWSEAGRRANARHAWHCVPQGAPPRDRTRATVGGRRARTGKRDASCDPTRFLCEQIHRGAHATEEEKAECAGYEAVHGRVSGR